jgi:uncharacterized membrane protein YkvA (DUF1232 family)
MGIAACGDEIMENCRKCEKPLGSSADCEECLHFLVEKGKETVNEESARRAESDAERWLAARGRSAPRRLLSLAELLVSLLRDYLKGEYKVVPWSSIAAVAFSTIYIVNIFDLVPDIIPVVGWADDVALVMSVLPGIRRDLEKYCEWKGLNPEDYGLSSIENSES